jgi:hypothetical protein
MEGQGSSGCLCRVPNALHSMQCPVPVMPNRTQLRPTGFSARPPCRCGCMHRRASDPVCARVCVCARVGALLTLSLCGLQLHAQLLSQGVQRMSAKGAHWDWLV